MESQAQTQPAGPRNLAAPIADWLRAQGFTCTLQEFPTLSVLQASWDGPRKEVFGLTYTWQAGLDATFQLRLLSAPPSLHIEILVASQRVRRVRDVRHLLLGSVRYLGARAMAKAQVAATDL